MAGVTLWNAAPWGFSRRASGWTLALALVVLLAPQLAAAQANPPDIVPPKIDLTTPGGVNIADGRFLYHVTDISIGPLTLERFGLGPPPLPADPYFGVVNSGFAMTHNFDIYVAPNIRPAGGPPWYTPAHYEPIVHLGNGASGVFYQAIGSSTVTTYNRDAQGTSLAVISGAYVYTDRAGTVYTFNPAIPAGGRAGVASQRIAKIEFPGGRVQTFTYDTGKRLKVVSDSSGYALVFDYNANDDVSAACGYNLSQTYVTVATTCPGSPLKTAYGYTSGSISSATDVSTQTTSLSPSCMLPPGYSTCKIASVTNSIGQVTQQTLAGGAVWKNTLQDLSHTTDPDYTPSDCDGEIIVTDPDNKETYYTFTKTSPCSVKDPLNRETHYVWTGATLYSPGATPYSEGTLLLEVTFPEGNKYKADYNGDNTISTETLVAKPGTTTLPDRIKSYGYATSGTTPQNRAKPIWIKDPIGNQTDYAYKGFGGTEWEMQPPPTTGAARPLKLYTYVEKSAYIKNSAGSLVSTGQSMWLADTETDCQTVAGSGNGNPVCDTTAPIVTIAYQYGADETADNLLLRGKAVTSGGVTLRTCYGYDGYGNRISETSPNAGRTTCP